MSGAVHPLADGRLVEAWEAAAERSPLERAPAILAQTLEDEDAAYSDDWPVGRSDAALLDLHAALFGPRITGVTECPACLEELELDFAVADVRVAHGDGAERLEVGIDSGHRVAFRLPTMADVADVRRCPTTALARRRLAEACVVEAFADGRAIAAAELPDAAVDAMDDTMADHDPQVELELALRCPECEHEWQGTVDVGDYVWRELDAYVRRLLCDVHQLASSYGWAEREILALTEPRRELYLELLTS
jgi:hypothetical protein